MTRKASLQRICDRRRKAHWDDYMASRTKEQRRLQAEADRVLKLCSSRRTPAAQVPGLRLRYQSLINQLIEITDLTEKPPKGG